MGASGRLGGDWECEILGLVGVHGPAVGEGSWAAEVVLGQKSVIFFFLNHIHRIHCIYKIFGQK
jgi:hypothetical protein